MTLHIVVTTRTDIVVACDRMLSISDGHVQLQGPRYKHVVLETDDARTLISFAGFAGQLRENGTLEETTADWLTKVLEAGMKKGFVSINDHVTRIRDEATEYLRTFEKRGVKAKDLRLAILCTGWEHRNAFNCVIDNCLESHWTWAERRRPSFTVRSRNYATADFRSEFYYGFLGQERLGLRQRPLRRLLRRRALAGDLEGVTDACVQIIAKAAESSKGTIGKTCSVIHLPRDSPGFGALLLEGSEKPGWTIFPNFVVSTSRVKVVSTNDEINRPRTPAKLLRLIAPATADTPRERLGFWHRALERLRLFHNEQGAKVRQHCSRGVLRQWHQWQCEKFNPVQTAALTQLREAKEALGPLREDAYYRMRESDKRSEMWDSSIDTSDVEPFEPTV